MKPPRDNNTVPSLQERGYLLCAKFRKRQQQNPPLVPSCTAIIPVRIRKVNNNEGDDLYQMEAVPSLDSKTPALIVSSTQVIPSPFFLLIHNT